MANIVTELLKGEANRLVAGLARESAEVKAGVREAGKRSAESRAVAKIRKQFPELTAGTKGYYAARNVFRIQERKAVNIFKNTNGGQFVAVPRSPDDPDSVRPPSRRLQEQILRVEITSQRGARFEWVTVVVTASVNASMAELSELARRAAEDLVEAKTGSGSLIGGLGERRKTGQIVWIG